MEIPMKKETKTAKRQPTHVVWQVIGENDKAKWIRVGAGWENKDGKGISLVFDAYPVTGRTVIREVTESEEAQTQGGRE
jgi:hypothetical protein